MAQPPSHWQFFIDTGGTFTDCLALSPQGELRRAKVLSSSRLRGRVAESLGAGRWRVEGLPSMPDGFLAGFEVSALGSSQRAPVRGHVDGILEAEAAALEVGAPCEFHCGLEPPVLGIRLMTGTPLGQPLPPLTLRLATTRGTNALLERRGHAPVLFITAGFADLLEIGTQARPDLFALNIRKPAPLAVKVIEVPERLASDGAVLEPLDLEALRPRIAECLAQGLNVAAVALLHSYRNPTHEMALSEELARAGFRHVSRSSELAPMIRILPRARTTAVNAYLAPIVDSYVRRVEEGIGRESLRQFHLMTSAGGLESPRRYNPKDSLLSGPAGGVTGIAHIGAVSGFQNLIGFDMGGTSTDVCRYDGVFDYVFEHTVGDATLVAPALAIETVAAGGGSICSFDGHRLRVGPESAGADPGPACYGAGGPLTITDVNLLLGRLDPGGFQIPVAAEPARRRLEEIRHQLAAAQGTAPEPRALLEGFLAIANERMADAIRTVSVRKGYHPSEYAMVSFGGAGGQHACAVARLLGMRTILVPREAGLLSALGLRHARLEQFAERQVLRPLRDVALGGLLHELAEEARGGLLQEGHDASKLIVARRIASLRYLGQDATLTVELESDEVSTVEVEERFHLLAESVYGHAMRHHAVELESVRVVAAVQGEARQAGGAKPATSYRPQPSTTAAVPTFQLDNFEPGAEVPGPALLFDAHSAVFLEENWRAELDPARTLILRWSDPQEGARP